VFSREAQRITQRAVFGSPIGWLALGYLLGLASAAWSPMPLYSGFRAMEQLSQLFAITVCILATGNREKAEKQVLHLFAGCLIINFLTVLKFYGFTLALAAWHTNVYTASSAMALCYCAGELMAGRKESRKLLWRYAGLSTFGILLGTSTASNLAAFCGLAVVGLVTRQGKIVFAVAAGVLVVAILMLGSGDLIRVVSGGKDPEKLRNMSGRTHIWEQYFLRFQQNPLTGEGYAVTARLSSDYRTNTHNSVISVATGMGIAGLLTFGIWAVLHLTWTANFVRLGQPGAVGSLAALTAGLINCLSCAYIGESYHPVTLTFNSLVVLSCLRVRSAVAGPARRPLPFFAEQGPHAGHGSK
jgi:O-antigen ligase